MMGLPVWFKSLVYSELFLQLPFFFVATYALLGALSGGSQSLGWLLNWPAARASALAHTLTFRPPDRRRRLALNEPAARRNWIRAPAMLYGAFVTATMVPILAELAAHTGRAGRRALVGGRLLLGAGGLASGCGCGRAGQRQPLPAYARTNHHACPAPCPPRSPLLVQPTATTRHL